MSRRLVTFLWIALAALSVLLGQTNAPPVLLYDTSGNPYPNGGGTPLPTNPPPMTCYTIVAGATVPCTFSSSGGGTTTNPLTMDASGTGAASGATFNGSAAVTLSYNTIGAAATGAANTFSVPQTISANGAASTSPLLLSGSLFTGGSVTTAYPALYIKAPGAADGGLNTNGNGVTVNAATGYTGNYFQALLNGVAQFTVGQFGGITSVGRITGAAFSSGTNCAAVGTAASPSVVSCTSSAAGAFACNVAASAATCTINSTAAQANTEIFVQLVSSEGARLGVTCNTAPTVVPPILLATKGPSTFTINMPTITTNPACFIYFLINV